MAPPREEPKYDARELYEIVPPDTKVPYDVREVIARLVDGSRFHEFKALYATTIVCGFAHLMGFPVGIIANNGILFSESALKAAHFIELCNQRKIPLCSCRTSPASWSAPSGGGRHRQGRRQDGDGRVLLVGAQAHRHHRRQLRGRELRHVRAGLLPPLPVDVAQRPLLGDGRRAGAWPPSSPPSGQLGVGRGGRGVQAPIRDQYERQGHPYYTTARLWDDGILDPLDTRQALGLALSAAYNAPIDPPDWGVFRM